MSRVVVIEKNKDGKIELTKEELQKMLETHTPKDTQTAKEDMKRLHIQVIQSGIQLQIQIQQVKTP